MIAIVCVEQRQGMLFNKRRVSRDSAVCRDMLIHCPQTLWMHPYSRCLFAQLPQAQICVAEDFLQRAEAGDWCFVENAALQPYEAKLEGLLIYRWNRNYPADTFLDIDLQQWALQWSESLTGTSHEIVTKEFYRRSLQEKKHETRA